jgi:uncharacterized protein (TIGR00730 family)
MARWHHGVMSDDAFDQADDDPATAFDEARTWAQLDDRAAPVSPQDPARAPQTDDEELLAAEEQAVVTERTDAQRVDRIAAELTMAWDLLRPIHHGVTVFGSARTKPESPEYEAARQLGFALGDAGHNVITGGGPGSMEAANRGAQEAKATSVGLRIDLPFEQGTNPWVDLDIKFNYFFTRKVCFVRYAAAFVVLPGGYGTLDELFETICLIQTGKVRQRPVILMDSSYWSGLLEWTNDQMVSRGILAEDDLSLFRVEDDLDEVLRLCGDASAAISMPRN